MATFVSQYDAKHIGDLKGLESTHKRGCEKLLSDLTKSQSELASLKVASAEKEKLLTGFRGKMYQMYAKTRKMKEDINLANERIRILEQENIRISNIILDLNDHSV